MKLLFTCSLIFSTCENSLLFCLCFLLISWMQCLTLLRMSCFFSPLFFDVFFFLSCLVSFKFLCVCFSLCLLSKMFGDSWVSVYLIVGLSKSSWKPCVCFLWAFLHSSLARVFHYYEIGIRIPFWYSNTIFHRDESSTVPVWGSIGLFVNVEVSSLVK